MFYDTATQNLSENKTRVLLSNKVLDFEERDTTKWVSFFEMAQENNLEIYEGFTEFNLFDYDIIVWDCCQSYKYNQYLFENVEALLKKGKYLIIYGSKSCFGRTANDLNPITSSQDANRITTQYGIRIEETMHPSSLVSIHQNKIFKEEFVVRTGTYAPLSVLSKSEQRNSKNVTILAKNTNGEGVLSVYTRGKNRGKLFVHGLGAYFLQGGKKENKMLKVFEMIVVDFKNSQKT